MTVSPWTSSSKLTLTGVIGVHGVWLIVAVGDAPANGVRATVATMRAGTARVRPIRRHCE